MRNVCNLEWAVKQIKNTHTLYVYRNNEAMSRDRCCRGTAITVTHSECVFVTLVIHYAKSMRRVVLSSTGHLGLPYFSTLSHKRVDFGENKVTEQEIVFGVSLQLLSETLIILIVFCVFLQRLSETLIILTRIH
jgi:hypothetical protein